MKKFSKKTFRKTPLASMSLLALAAAVSGNAYGAVETIAGGSAAAATDITEASPTTLNATADNVFGEVDANGNTTFDGATGETTGTVDIDGTATLFVFDSDSGAAGTITLNADADGAADGSINVADGKTLTLTLGQDGDAANTNAVNLSVEGKIVTNTSGIVNITTNGTSVSKITLKETADLGTGTISLKNAGDTVTLNNTAAVTGNIDNASGSDGKGILTVADQAGGAITAVSGNVGATNSLATVNVTSTANTVTFGGTVNATNINITGVDNTDITAFSGDVTGKINFSGDSKVTIAADKKIVGSVTTGGAGQGTLDFAAATADTTIVSGDIGTNALDLKAVNVITGAGKTSTLGGGVYADTITITGTGTAAFNGVVDADTKFDVGAAATITLAEDITTADLEFSADGTVTLAANKKIIGSVSADTDGQGSLVFSTATTNTTLVNGAIGADGNELKAVTVNTGAGVTSTIDGAVYAKTLTINGTGTAAISGAIDAATKLAIAGAATVNTSADIAAPIEFGADGTLTLAADKKIVGAVTSTGTGQGTITFGTTATNTTLASSTIGTSGNDLKAINVTTNAGITSTFAGDVFSDTINVGGVGTTAFSGDVDADTALNFTADGLVTIAADKTITGNVTTSSAGQGTLTFATATASKTLVSGSVGSATLDLKALNLTTAGGQTSTFGGAIYADTITVLGTGTAKFDGDVDADTKFDVGAAGTIDFDGNLTTANLEFSADGTAVFAANKGIVGAVSVDTDGQGTVTFETATANATLATGNLGATNKELKVTTVNTGAGFTSAFGGNVHSKTITVNGTGTAAFGGAVEADTKFDVGAAATVTLADDITTADLEFSADGTVNIAANKKIVGAVSNDTDGHGTLTFATATTDTVLVSGAVGADNNELLAVTVNTGSGAKSSFGGAVYARTLTFAGNGTAEITGAVDAVTKVDVTGSATITAKQDVTTALVDFGADGNLTLAAGKKVVGAVDNTTGGDGVGTLVFGATGGAVTLVSGTVGATNSLKQVTVDTTGGAATFTGAVKSTTFNASGNSDAIFTGGLTATTVSSTATGALTFNGATTVTNLTHAGAVGGTGALDVNGTASITGAVTVGASNATFAGNTTAGSFNIAGGNITFDGGATAQTITGAIDGANTITVTNTAGATFTSAIGGGTKVTEVAVAANQKAIFNQAVTTTTFDIDGIVQVDVNGNTADTLELAAGSKLILGTGVSDGETVFTNATALTTADGVTVELPTTFKSGTITLSSANGDSTKLGHITVSDTALVDYTAKLNGAAIEVEAAAKSVTSTASELGISQDTAEALAEANEALASGDTEALTAFSTALNAGGTEAKKAAEQVTIQTDTLGASSTAAIGTGGQVFSAASNRLAYLRADQQYGGISGIATGDEGMSNAAWVKPFGNWISQDTEGTNAGFDADTYGIAFGFDTSVSENKRVGVSFAISDTDVDGKGTGQSQVDISSYQFTVYADHTEEDYYVEGLVGFARNDNDSSRVINFGGLNRQAKASYDSNQFMFALGAGLPMEIGEDSYITPTAGIAYTQVDTDDYTETGAGNLNIAANPDDVYSFVGSLGAKVHGRFGDDEEGYFIPSARLGLSYDFSGDEAAASGKYTGGGSTFRVEGAEVEQFGTNIGLGLAYDTSLWSIGLNYDADLKSGYAGHSLSLEAKFKF